MKHKTLFILLGTLCTSCNDSYLQTLYDDVYTAGVSGQVLSRADDGLTHDEYVFSIQSDPLSMLIGRVEQTGNGYTLNLSMEESRMLGIPDSLYMRALEVVDDINNMDQGS